jgi:hypothetical protein
LGAVEDPGDGGAARGRRGGHLSRWGGEMRPFVRLSLLELAAAGVRDGASVAFKVVVIVIVVAVFGSVDALSFAAAAADHVFAQEVARLIL